MQLIHLVVPPLVLLCAGAAAAQGEAPTKKPPQAPVSAALDQALAKATVHNKRVLAVLADTGDDFAARLKKDRTLSRPLLYEFEVVQLAGPEADAFAVHWKMPDALNEKPALAVLDADGKLLERMPKPSVLGQDGLDGSALLEQLRPHFCAAVDAEKKLASGLAEAKKTGRAVFVRFDAPW